MMQKLYAFLARAPALQGLTVQVGDVGPAPGTAGLWAGGITVWLRSVEAYYDKEYCFTRFHRLHRPPDA